MIVSTTLGGYAVCMHNFVGFHPWVIMGEEGTLSEDLRFGFLRQGNEQLCGDNSCSHMKLDGNTYILPQSPYITVRDVYDAVLQMSLKKMFFLGYSRASDCTHLVPRGGSVLKDNLNMIQPSWRAKYETFHDGSFVITKITNQYGSVSYAAQGIRQVGTGSFQVTNQVFAPTIWEVKAACTNESWSGAESIPIRINPDFAKAAYYRAVADIRLQLKADFMPSPPIEDMRGELCQKSIQSLQYLNINSLAFAKDLMRIKELLPPIKDLKNIKNPKSWASVYLWLRYGVSLTVKDSKEIIHSISRACTDMQAVAKKPWQTCRAKEVTIKENDLGRKCRVEYNYTTRVTPIPGNIMSFIRNALVWDLWPTPANLYDFIPFSFVLDWFINVGDNFEVIDTYGLMQYYNCMGTTYTVKQIIPFVLYSSPHYSVFGDINLIIYNRSVYQNFDTPHFDLDLSLPSANQIVDSVALIVQNIRK